LWVDPRHGFRAARAKLAGDKLRFIGAGIKLHVLLGRALAGAGSFTEVTRPK
jgi:hypothetical protein